MQAPRAPSPTNKRKRPDEESGGSPPEQAGATSSATTVDSAPPTMTTAATSTTPTSPTATPTTSTTATSSAPSSATTTSATSTSATKKTEGGGGQVSDIILSTLQRIATRSPLTLPNGGGGLNRSSSPHSFLGGQHPSSIPATSSHLMMAPDVMGPGYGEGSSWNPVPPQLPPQMQAPSQQQPPQQHQHQHQPQMQTHLQHQHQPQMQQMGQQQGISPQQMMQAPSQQQPQQQMTQHYVVQHHPGHPHHQHHQFPYHPQHPHHQFNPHNQHHHGRVYKPRPSPIPFDDGQILLPSFVSSLSSASARSSSPRSFTASTLLYPLPEDEEAMLQVLEIPHLPNDAGAAVAGGDQSSAMMNNGNGGGASSTSASGMPADFGVGDPSQFVPSQHSAFRTPLSRPIAKKPDGQQAMRPHSPQHVMPSGAGAGATHNHQHQHQHQHNHQHQFQQHQQHLQHQHIMHQQHTNAGISPHQLQMPMQQQQPTQLQQFQQQPQAQLQGQQQQQTRPVVLDREQQLQQVEGILRDAHNDNSSACSKKDIEIFTHHAAMQRMAHESIKKRVQLHQQQQQQQQQGQSSPSSSSSPDIGQQGSDGQPAAKKSKSNRSRTDQAQYQQLEDVFLRDPLPSRKTKERLAQELGLTARKVQVWFQNRRAKERRQLREMGINDSTILPNPWGE